MQIIKEISEYIEEELEGARKYAEKALMHKGMENNIADMYYRMSVDEMKHVDMLHEQGLRLINDFKLKGEIIPQSMQAIYDYLHEKHIEKANEVAMYQKQFKE